MKRSVRIILIIICLAVMALSAYKLYGYWSENKVSAITAK